MNETVALAIILIPCLIVAIVFHEVAHGWTARLLGDPTAAERNRLSFNPLRHIDPIGTVVLPGFLALIGAPVFGWAKPVPINFRRLNNPRRDMIAVAAAGPGTNFALALLGAIALGLLARGMTEQPTGALQFLFAGLNFFILINIFLGLFNLIPLPPFDGSHIVEGLLPREFARSYGKLRPYGLPLLFLLLLVIPWLLPGLGIIENFVVPPVEWVRAIFMNLTIAIAGG